MHNKRRRKLRAAGWRVGTAAEFLKLTPVESALIDMRLALGSLVRNARVRSGLSQLALATRLRSSQSRVAKLEAATGGVSLDLLIKAALAAGAKKRELAKVIGA